MRNDARLLAYSILYQFNNDIKLDLILNKAFIDNKSDLRSRSRANVLVNDIVRLRGRLDLMIKHVSGRKIKQIQRPIRLILRIGFYEIMMDESVPDYAAVDSAVEMANNLSNSRSAGFANAVLRNLTRKKKNNCEETMKTKYSKQNFDDFLPYVHYKVI